MDLNNQLIEKLKQEISRYFNLQIKRTTITIVLMYSMVFFYLLKMNIQFIGKPEYMYICLTLLVSLLSFILIILKNVFKKISLINKLKKNNCIIREVFCIKKEKYNNKNNYGCRAFYYGEFLSDIIDKKKRVFVNYDVFSNVNNGDKFLLIEFSNKKFARELSWKNENINEEM